MYEEKSTHARGELKLPEHLCFEVEDFAGVIEQDQGVFNKGGPKFFFSYSPSAKPPELKSELIMACEKDFS